MPSPAGTANTVHGAFERARSSLVIKAALTVLALVSPLVLLAFVVINSLSTASEDAQKRFLLYTANSIASAVDTQLQRYLTIGTMLAASEHLLRDDLPAFSEQARAMLGDAEVIVVLHDGPRQVVNSAFPDVRALPERSAEGYRAQLQAAAENKIVVSDIYVGALRKQWIATVEIPPSKVAGNRYSLSIVLQLQPFQRLLNTASVAPGWLVGIADASGRFVAGFPLDRRSAGDPISSDWRKRLRVPGLDEFNNIEGQGVINANALPRLSRWTVGVAITRASLDASVVQTTRWAFWVTIGVLTGLAAAALLLVKRLSESLDALQSGLVARLVGATAPLPQIPSEFARLWDAVDRASDARSRAERTLEKTLHDVQQANDEVRRSTQILQAISDLSPDLIFAKDRQRKLLFVSRSLTRLLQKSAPELLGKDERSFLNDPEEIKTIEEHDHRVLAGEAITREEPVTDPDGKRRIFLSNKLPWRDETGEIIGILGISVDITERQENEQRMFLVMREVSHRSKNMLAVVQSVARSSNRFARSKDEFVEQFNGRLLSLAHSLDLLVSNDWRGVDLSALILTQLGHFEADLGKRIIVKGPTFSLTAMAAQTLGMALHELATNAGKYGALSVPNGEVHITWDVAPTTFAMSWTESNGPPVEPPTRRGFGSTVIETLVRSTFSCCPVLSFAPAGFRWSLACERSELEAGTANSG